MKEIIIKDGTGFRLRVTIKDVLTPENLKNVEFIQESKNKNGEVDFTSIYQFFMSSQELVTLGNFLANIETQEVSSTQGPMSFVTKVFSRSE
jgi:hypothetical protein